MSTTPADAAALALIDARLNTILPEEYQGAYDEVQPTPMGSAGLRYDADGRVAWDEIWGSFCDLAMAGGPPHKGRLLQPGSHAEISASPGRYSEVLQEICRGVRLVTDLDAAGADPGWVRVRCFTETMAAWLLRAITMENVAVRGQRDTIDLPVSPAYRLEKEIKNVITVIAKTCHYWAGHMPRVQRDAIGDLFAELARESPLLTPDARTTDIDAHRAVADAIRRTTGLSAGEPLYPGWIGVELPGVRTAVRVMRALVVSNVLARREETVLYLPVNQERDPEGQIVATVFARVYRLTRDS